MKEVKSPKKPLVYYYGIVLLVLLVFNLIVSPLLLQKQVTETDYGTFMKMIEDQQIGRGTGRRQSDFVTTMNKKSLQNRCYG